jgi:cyclase
VIQEIGPSIFVETEFHGANVAFIVTDEGMILIDTPLLPDYARLWRREIGRRTDQPIIYIINTDHHRGHILGSQCFPSAMVLAHEIAWKNMRSYGDSLRPRLPNLYRESMPEATEEWRRHLRLNNPETTFTGRTILCKGDKEIHLMPVGGHTEATTVVHLPRTESSLLAIW